ncbi:unnamed protein product [Effrenium voratum]|nr:unnamed protein product [Effrenium voratum]
MKRPAALVRRQNKQGPRACDACGSTAHRIETCKTKAAAEIRKLRAQVRKLTEGRPKNAVLRKERKTRKSPKVSQSLASREEALAECGSHSLSNLLWPGYRPAHWRCLKCGVRLGLFALSIFAGLRCGAAALHRLLLKYVALDMSKSPKINDLIQTARLGHAVVRHFVAAMRALESAAGKQMCQSARLKGSVEGDGTFITCFHISRQNPHYADLVYSLEQHLAKKKLKPQKVYVCHVMLLGVMERGGSPVISSPSLRLTPKGECSGPH